MENRSNAVVNVQPVDNKSKRRRGKKKGRQVDLKTLEAVRGVLAESPRQRDYLIENLHLLQDAFGALYSHHLVALASEMSLSMAEVLEVASFYHHFDIVKDGEQAPAALTVRVCDSVSCCMAGADELSAALEQQVGSGVRVQRVPCVGRCAEAPVAVVGWHAVGQASTESVVAAIAENRVEANATPKALDYAAYVADGGYSLYHALLAGERDDESFMQALEGAGLRGLGGAGFPAGRKWRILRDQPAPKLMAVNIDEGEPGTFKDRHYLERDPHRLFEGILIAARVIGIEQVYVYVRDEYPHVRTLLQRSWSELQSAFDDLPELQIRRGAGAYICGEESAMIESIEGKRGMPRLRPPYVAEVGLFGRPTLEHNCETLYWVREIVERGAEWFSGHGRHGRKGLRSFSVSGRVKNPGVHVAPAGITLNELIDEYCGGMLDGHQLQAYFPGGASGGILPASLADVPLDFDTLQEFGSFIGSAAVIVLSDQDSVRDAALNAMRFFSHESCGQCTPCRVGTQKASVLMAEEDWDHELLEDLCTVMADASICGLGQAAPNPARTVMKYFPQLFNKGESA
ncbi:MAG: NAD(P)H-dependent oxidoreductase subunit E [Granulosicoccaceae bacterium]